MVAEQQTAARVGPIADELGLTIAAPVQALGVLAELYENKPVTSEDIVELLDGDLAMPIIHLSLRWASLLSLIAPAGAHQWTISPMLQRVLRHLKRGQI
jgi:hypothetical protein